MVTSGMLVNLIFYLYTEMHISFPNTSTLMTNVIGTSGITPLLGAFIADAYLGRYFTIAIFSIIYFVVRLPYSTHTHTHTHTHTYIHSELAKFCNKLSLPYMHSIGSN
jgi:dipeptide/tripeptide permease